MHDWGRESGKTLNLIGEKRTWGNCMDVRASLVLYSQQSNHI